jgi:hypothetical protein
MLSWYWRSIKLLLLHLVGVPYYFTYIKEYISIRMVFLLNLGGISDYIARVACLFSVLTINVSFNILSYVTVLSIRSRNIPTCSGDMQTTHLGHGQHEHWLLSMSDNCNSLYDYKSWPSDWDKRVSELKTWGEARYLLLILIDRCFALQFQVW